MSNEEVEVKLVEAEVMSVESGSIIILRFPEGDGKYRQRLERVGKAVHEHLSQHHKYVQVLVLPDSVKIEHYKVEEQVRVGPRLAGLAGLDLDVYTIGMAGMGSDVYSIGTEAGAEVRAFEHGPMISLERAKSWSGFEGWGIYKVNKLQCIKVASWDVARHAWLDAVAAHA